MFIVALAIAAVAAFTVSLASGGRKLSGESQPVNDPNKARVLDHTNVGFAGPKGPKPESLNEYAPQSASPKEPTKGWESVQSWGSGSWERAKHAARPVALWVAMNRESILQLVVALAKVFAPGKRWTRRLLSAQRLGVLKIQLV